MPSKTPTDENRLSIKFPELSKEWHPTKNGELTPYDFTIKSDKKAWWKCEKGHEYLRRIKSQTNLQNKKNKCLCPYCKPEKIKLENSLAIIFPEIAKDWDFTKNGELTPDFISGISRNKVWWKCHKCGEKWESYIYGRTMEGRKCKCQKVNDSNSLSSIRPNASKD